jgi:hypothetical protein
MPGTVERPWILVAPDRLSARLRLPRDAHVDLASARDLLASAGLRVGIDGEALRAASAASAQERVLLIASGQPPPAIPRLELTRVIEVGRPVTAGQVVATTAHRGPVAGVGVDGLPIPVASPGIGLGLALGEDGVVVARRDGVLRTTGDGTLVVARDGVAETAVAQLVVQFDTRTTEAWCELPAHQHVPEALLCRLLAEQRIVRGVRGEVFAEASLPVDHPRRLHLATGVPPVPGEDGRLHLLIDERVHLRVDAHGRVDWHDHGRSEDVALGTPLARILPPTAGRHGVDARGACLEPRPGRPLDPARAIGEGTRLNAQEPDLIEAAVAGHFHRDRARRLCVQTRLVVDGDVDFRHGNIDTTLSVLVKGDVKAGFAIKSAGDIEVMGVIEDARISAQGRLIVKGGILPGGNRVKAHGDIDARYVTNREIKCHSLRVGGSLRWSRVLATGEVIAKEILAGEVICAGSITVDQVGNADGLHTRLQVGIDPFSERQFIAAREEHPRLVAAVHSGKERCKLIAHQIAGDPSRAAELRAALEEFSAACARLAAGEACIERHAHQQQAHTKHQITAIIQVGNVAHRGVEVLFGEVAKLVLDQDLARPRFRWQDGAIVW